MTSTPQTLGLLAGSGRLPFALATAARAAGHRVVVVAHEGETDPAIEALVDQLTWVKLGQLKRIAIAFVDAGVSRVVMAGGLRKANWFSARPDLAAIKLIATLPSRGDDRVLRAIAGWLGEQGLEIVAATDVVSDCCAPEGLLGGPAATEAQLADVAEGVRIARLVGLADIGQTIVIREGAVLAVEAMEGTDDCIRRAGRLAADSVVIKLCKPNQDRRFDLPTIGPGTLAALADAKAKLLAVEAGVTVVIDRDELAREANRLRISVLGVRG